MLLPQDLYVLLKLLSLDSKWTYQSISEDIFLSTSQIYAGLNRAENAGLFSKNRRKLVLPALQEFIIHGVRYAYPIQRAGLIYGLPTSFAGEPLKSQILSKDTVLPVWPYPDGEIVGYEVEPLHPAAPKAALRDKKFYELLALVDAMREGRARERKLTEKELMVRLHA